MESYSNSKTQSWLTWFLKGLLFLGFLIIFARLVDLQVIKGSYYRELSEKNKIRRVVLEAPRGKIYSRDGEVLASNKILKEAVVFDKRQGYITTDDIGNAVNEDLIDVPLRTYPTGDFLGHIVGYVSGVNKDELGKVNPECSSKGEYGILDKVGKMGLESFYDCKLRGTNGELLIETDAHGNKVRLLGEKVEVPGEDIKTNIDIKLQKKLSELLIDKKGSVIVSDEHNRILGMYSSPSFDPNFFTRLKSEEIENYFTDTNLPLFNRAIGGRFPPGSVYKPLVSIGALEDSVIDRQFTFVDEGKITLNTLYGDFTYNNWYYTQYGGVEGEIDLTKALARSTDTFFYKIGELLGPEAMSEWSGKFGFGTKTGIDLPGEVSGIIPSPIWKRKVKEEKWFIGNTYHMAIGQGDLAVTPLEIHSFIASLANSGRYCTPRLVGNGECKNLDININNIDFVVEGMEKACSPGGTAFTFFDVNNKDGSNVACKTGTAQTTEETNPHAWFVFFTPISKPEIVVTVMIENGGEGSRVAGPIAREIYDYWKENM